MFETETPSAVTCAYNISKSVRPDLRPMDCGRDTSYMTVSEFPEGRCLNHMLLELGQVMLCNICNKPVNRVLAAEAHLENCISWYNCYHLEGEWSCTCVEESYTEIEVA